MEVIDCLSTIIFTAEGYQNMTQLCFGSERVIVIVQTRLTIKFRSLLLLRMKNFNLSLSRATKPLGKEICERCFGISSISGKFFLLLSILHCCPTFWISTVTKSIYHPQNSTSKLMFVNFLVRQFLFYNFIIYSTCFAVATDHDRILYMTEKTNRKK